MPIVTWIRSSLFNLCAALYTVLCLSFVYSLPRAYARGWAQRWAKGTITLARWILGLNFKLIAPYPWEAKQPLLVACKHQSTWETIIFFALLHHPIYVLKDSLLTVPLLGKCLKKLGMIAVKRQGGGSSLTSMLHQAKTAYTQGCSIIIFPEGTRQVPLKPTRYFRGIYHLSQTLGCSVTPIALNSGCFWGRRSWIKHPGCITLQVLTPLPSPLPACESDFMVTLEKTIETASSRLCQDVNRT